MLRWVPCVGTIAGDSEIEYANARRVARVPGLYVSKNVVTKVEEIALLEAIDKDGREWIKRKTRMTKNYGPFYTYQNDSRKVCGFGHTDVPRWADGFLENRTKVVCADIIDADEWSVNQVHVAFYRAKENNRIRLHNDCSMGDLGNAVVGISLGSACVMTFVHRGVSVKVKLPRRSLYCMTNESLRVWKHAIDAKHVKHDRVSITLRQVHKLYVPETLTFQSFYLGGRSNIFGNNAAAAAAADYDDDSDGGGDEFKLRSVFASKVDEEHVKQTCKMHGFLSNDR